MAHEHRIRLATTEHDFRFRMKERNYESKLLRADMEDASSARIGINEQGKFAWKVNGRQ